MLLFNVKKNPPVKVAVEKKKKEEMYGPNRQLSMSRLWCALQWRRVCHGFRGAMYFLQRLGCQDAFFFALDAPEIGTRL